MSLYAGNGTGGCVCSGLQVNDGHTQLDAALLPVTLCTGDLQWLVDADALIAALTGRPILSRRWRG